MCYLMTTFRCPSDILITSWLFTARCTTWPGNHLVPCVDELVASCIPIHAHRCLPDPKCLYYLSGLSLCLSVDHFCLVPVDDIIIVLIHGVVCDGWLLPACLPDVWAAVVLARHMIDQFGLLFILDLVLQMYHKGTRLSLGNIFSVV